MTSNHVIVFRTISTTLVTLTLILFTIDLFLHSGDKWNGIGLLSTWVLPPIGFFLAGTTFKNTGSKKDVLLLCLNGIAFFAIAIIMVEGTWFLGT